MNYKRLPMDSKKSYRISSLPLESEFRVLSVRRRLHELSREELEEFLTEALTVMARLAHQLRELRDYIENEGGKID
jgi:hypothetical protein